MLCAPGRDSVNVRISVVFEISSVLQLKSDHSRKSSQTIPIPKQAFWKHPNMNKIAKLLQRKCNRIALSGMSGMGKSTMASMIAHVLIVGMESSPPMNLDSDLKSLIGKYFDQILFVLYLFFFLNIGTVKDGICWLNFGQSEVGNDGIAQACELLGFFDGSDPRKLIEIGLQGQQLAHMLGNSSKGIFVCDL